jgi:hypothetical protein
MPTGRTRGRSLKLRATWTAASALRGISINPIVTMRSGLPLSIIQNNLFPDAVKQRPNAIGPMDAIYEPHMVSQGTGISYLRAPGDPGFPLAPSGPLFSGSGSKRQMLLPASIGTLGRDTIRTLGDINVNLSVNRRFHLSERVALQLRADAFNALNHTNFKSPSNTLNVTANAAGNAAIFSSPGFGLITAARSARFMQLVARFEF